MNSTRVERPEQLTVEVGRWSASVTSIVVTLVFVLVVGMLANSVRANNGRAEDWRRRAVAAEEAVGGLRVVLADRSKALNQRTRQTNLLIGTLASSRGALRETKVNLGALERRERRLASEKARAELDRRELVSAASALSSCSQGLATVVADARRGKPKVVLARGEPHLAQCSRARARLGAVLRRVG